MLFFKYNETHHNTEHIQNILSLKLTPHNLSPQNISKHILSATKLIIAKLIKLKNLSNIKTYQNKTYQTTKPINKIQEPKISNH